MLVLMLVCFTPIPHNQTHLAGEMVFPWMFEEFAELRKIKDAAELVAADAGGWLGWRGWPQRVAVGRLGWA